MTARDLTIAVALVIAYILVQNRTIRYAKPLRAEIERKGKELLADQRLEWPLRQSIEFMIDYAGSPWVAPAAAVIGLILTILVAFRLYRLPKHQAFPDEEIKEKYRYIDARFTTSIIAATPLGGLLLINAIIIMITVLAVSGMTWEIFDEVKTSAAAAVNRRLRLTYLQHVFHWH